MVYSKMSNPFDISTGKDNINMNQTGMPIGAIIFLGAVLLVFAALDGVMLFSLLRPGDERGQIVVWKASAFTLASTTGAHLLNVAVSFIWARSMSTNCLVQLEVAAILYCLSLLYYRRRHGG